MPYIKVAQRGRARLEPNGAGELTFALQQLIQHYLLTYGVSFGIIAEIDAAVVEVMRDFHDRIVAPYEAVKCAMNGDVWDPKLIATNR